VDRLNSGSEVLFYTRSLILAYSHVFDNIGTGTNYLSATIQSGAIGNEKLETNKDKVGIILYNSQNQSGFTKFGDNAFQFNTGNNLLVNVEFGVDAFNNSSGTNTITNILLSNSNDSFALNYQGTMNILGNIGTTEGNDYANFFSSGASATINAKVAKQTSNGGSEEGDLLAAETNGAVVNYVL
jgi:hypothetical protein